MAVGGGYGLQFQPGVPQNGEKTGNSQRGRLQEPVQVLSTRLPKFFGGGAIAPASLLQGGGGMGMAGSQGNVVAQALAQLAGLPPSMQAQPPGGGYGAGIGLGGLGAGFGSAAPMSAPPPYTYSPPPPVVRPGDRPGQPPPIIQPEPGPPGPPPVLQPPPQLPIGGRLPFPGTIVRDDGATFPREGDDVIRLFASRLFR